MRNWRRKNGEIRSLIYNYLKDCGEKDALKKWIYKGVGRNMEEKTILVNVEEARELLGGIGRNCIYNLAKDPKFPSFRIGNRIFINRLKPQE